MNPEISLTETIEIIAPYKGKTKFDFWTNLKPGDTVEISMLLKSPGRSTNGTYATTLRLLDIKKQTTFAASIAEIHNYLRKMEYKVYFPIPEDTDEYITKINEYIL
jgi:hypothetical protein